MLYTTLFRSPLSLIIALTTAFTCGSLLNATTVHPLDLNDWPNGWTVISSDDERVASVVRDGDVSYLRIGRLTAEEGQPNYPASGAIAFWKGNATIDPVLTDYSGSVVMRSNSYSSNATYGVIVGAERMGYTNNAATNSGGYYIGLGLPMSGSGLGLGIWYDPRTGANNTDANAVRFTAIGSDVLQSTDVLLLEFNVTGNMISGELWRLGTNDEKVGNRVAAVSFAAEDAVDGYFGLMGGRFNGIPREVQFRDVELQIIPEPSAAFYFGSIIGLLILARRVMRRSETNS